VSDEVAAVGEVVRLAQVAWVQGLTNLVHSANQVLLHTAVLPESNSDDLTSLHFVD